MSHLLVSLVVLLNDALGFYLTLIIARVIMGLLVNFGILNGTNAVVAFFHDAVAALVDPITAKLTSWMPFLVFGSVDLSPVALYIIVQIVQVGLLSIIL
jgi:uncharacterized protein YggT (Ycf19 family)